MRRKKRFTILQLAFALAAVAILPVTAQAKPMPGGGQERLGVSQIPYLTQGPDNRTPARAAGALAQTQVGTSPDDRPYSRATNLETTPVVSDGGTTIDISPYAVTGFGLALLLGIGGMGVAIRHTRKGKLSPA